MIPIKYNGSNWEVCSTTDEEWYNYTKDITGDGKVDTNDFKWANVMLSDGTYKGATATVGTVIENDSDLGSMFVWIPRYAYSFNKYKTAIDETATPEGTTQNITNVTFLVGATNRDSEGNVYKTDYNVNDAKVGESTPKIVHPAFKFGEDNLTGIWSAKFEASMEEENGNLYSTNDNTTKTLKIVPNAESWRYIQVGNMFTNCLNMNKTSNIYGLISTTYSHLMKNNEWGALAYLAVSQYGVTPARNTSGVLYNTVTNADGSTIDQYHSYSAGSGSNIGGDYKTNTTQSTTGNATGIYDLNGGAWEFVAAYWDNGNGNLSGQGTSAYFEGNKLNADYTKYWDVYEVSENEITGMKAGLWDLDNTYNSVRKQITEERYNLMRNKKGDALYETIKTWSYYGRKIDGNYDWLIDESKDKAQYGKNYYNDDYALIGNCSIPFLLRGGFWGSSAGAGIFASLGYTGGAYYNRRFPSGARCGLAIFKQAICLLFLHIYSKIYI